MALVTTAKSLVIENSKRIPNIKVLLIFQVFQKLQQIFYKNEPIFRCQTSSHKIHYYSKTTEKFWKISSVSESTHVPDDRLLYFVQKIALLIFLKF